MSLTPQQERAFIAELEKMGRTEARSRLDHGTISPAFAHITWAWLAEKEREDERRRDTFNSEQIEIARVASLAAEAAAKEAARASAAAERQAAAAERQATAAERANRRATIALVIAIASMITTIVGIWITHSDVERPTWSENPG